MSQFCWNICVCQSFYSKINVNKCLKHLFPEQHINIVKQSHFKAFGLSVVGKINFIVYIYILFVSPFLVVNAISIFYFQLVQWCNFIIHMNSFSG